MTNALIDFITTKNSFPFFKGIEISSIESTLDQILTRNKTKLAELLEKNKPYQWDNFVDILEAYDDELDQLWSPIEHLNAVMNSNALRKVYQACLPKLSQYATEMGQNQALQEAYQAIANSAAYPQLNQAQQQSIQHALRDFHLSGVDLAPQAKQRFADIQQQLSQLTNKFSNNILDATHAWSRLIIDENELSGLPSHVIQAARNRAHKKGIAGWLLTLDAPCFIPVMENADNRALRQEIHTAYITRTSEVGPYGGQWDNTPVMEEILKLRHELAQLLGFKNFAEYSLATKMANEPEEVLKFLNELADRSIAQAHQEFAELKAFAEKYLNGEEIKAWDIAYYSEKLRKEKYAMTQEELRPYFPENKVLEGLFTIVNRLFGITVSQLNPQHQPFDVWHEEVKLFSIHDQNNKLRGYFYLDLYARENKRGGAWMSECRNRRRLNPQEIQIPIAFLTCNLNAPVDQQGALFSHDEVVTIFHEFGHTLHHLLTQIEVGAVSGINGVPWDAVELPSQFLENWCWEKEALNLISGHVETGKPIPEQLFTKLEAAKNFQSAMHLVRQLEFSLFDFCLHQEFDPQQPQQIQAVLDRIRNQVSVVPAVPWNRFQHSFSHIFAGGYAAGYYSYKWAEVLASDAYSKFEEKGIFDPQTGQEFMESILEKGGSEEPMDLYCAFRGRKPTIDALLRHNGII